MDIARGIEPVNDGLFDEYPQCNETCLSLHSELDSKCFSGRSLGGQVCRIKVNFTGSQTKRSRQDIGQRGQKVERTCPLLPFP